MHSGKDFIKIRHQQQAEQSELSREEQVPRVIFRVLLPVLKERQDREKTKGWQAGLPWSQRQNKNTCLKVLVSCSEDKYIPTHSVRF